MGDSVTVTTHKSWLQRIISSFAGVIIGIILIIAMVFGLFWNEGRAVQTARSLDEGLGLVVTVPSTSVDAANEGKLVHTSGPVKVEGRLVDPMFGISAEGVRLVRNVEMFQWTEESKSETQKNLGGSEETVTTYTYRKEWSPAPVDSSEFQSPGGHENPEMTVTGTSIQTPSATLGAFELRDNILSAISDVEDLPVTQKQKAEVEAAFAEMGVSDKKVQIVGGKIVVSANAGTPAIGDLRVGYGLIPAGSISLVARQDGQSFSAYQTTAGDELQLVESGIVASDKMFSNAQTTNTVITWALRVAGLGLLFLGFALVLGPLSVIADVVPFLGALVGLSTGLLSLVLALTIGSTTIAFAWFFYRPLLSLIILAVGGLVAAGVVMLIRSKAKAKATPANVAPAGLG